jgi:hypothetical protein
MRLNSFGMTLHQWLCVMVLLKEESVPIAEKCSMIQTDSLTHDAAVVPSINDIPYS